MHFYKLIIQVVGSDTKYQVRFTLRNDEIPMTVDDLKTFRGVIEIAEEFNYIILDVIEIMEGEYDDVVEFDRHIEIVDYTKDRKTKEYNRFYIRTIIDGDPLLSTYKITEISKNGGKFRDDDRFDHILCDLNLDEIFKYVKNNFIEIV